MFIHPNSYSGSEVWPVFMDLIDFESKWEKKSRGSQSVQIVASGWYRLMDEGL
jgi:hypothetical protein